MFKALNPFPIQTPKAILTRQYKITDITIVPGWTGTRIGFPAALRAVPAVAKALSSFYFFRSHVEISVKINATPYHQGMTQISWLPDCKVQDGVNGPLYDQSVTQLSALGAILLNYSSSDSVTMQYGWMHSQVYMPLSDITNHYIGQLFVMPLIPISNTTGGQDTITATVYARFVDPICAGFVNQPIAESSKDFPFKTTEQEEKSETRSTVSDTHDSLLSPLFRSVSLVEGTVASAIDLFGNLTKMLDKPLDIAMPMRMQYGLGSDMIQGAGLQIGERLTLYPTSKLAKFGLDGCLDTQASITELAMKPMLHAIHTFTPSDVTFNLYAHPASANNANGNSDEVIFPDYLHIAAGMHRYWKGGIKYLMYFVTNAFTTARFRISYIIDYSQDNLAYGGDFPSQIIEVKGSTLVKITVPYLFNTLYRPVIPLEAAAGTAFNKSPKIAIQALTIPRGGQGSEPAISLVVFRAAAEDMQFCSLRSTVVNPKFFFTDQITEPIAECMTALEFEKKFPPISCNCTLVEEQGFATTETTGRIHDIMKRFAPATSAEIIQDMVVDPFNIDPNLRYFEVGPGASVDSVLWLNPYYQILQLFKYQRGSIRYRFSNTGTDQTTEIFTPASLVAPDEGSGMSLWVKSHNPIHTLEIPWNSTVPQYPTESSSIINPLTMEVSNFSAPPAEAQVFVSFGDDRVHTFLMPPAPFIWKPEAVLNTTLNKNIKLGNTSNTSIRASVPNKKSS